MMVPRVARVTIQGTNPSLPATECLGVVGGTAVLGPWFYFVDAT